jgi:pyruvate dehydrogenase E2 component (dihydrolipoamide acetyltransferase)
VAIETIKIPDLGGGDGVEVIEICVAVGDVVEAEDSLLVLESDKASMEVPAPQSGTVKSIALKVGDTVSEGDVILELELADGAQAESAPAESESATSVEEPVVAESSAPEPAAPAPSGGKQTVVVPDIGTGDEVEVIEICVAEGDEVEEGDSLVVLESDKASMEVPSPYSGVVLAIKTSNGAKVSQGSELVEMSVAGQASAAPTEAAAPSPAPVAKPVSEPASAPAPKAVPEPVTAASDDGDAGVYAGPAVRKLAREFGIPLSAVTGTGPRGRVVKEDLHAYAKSRLASPSVGGAATGGAGIPPVPEIDFSQFGEIDVQPMSKMHKLTAANMHRSWLNVPHVTQFDDADITELEDFRNSMKREAEQRGVKLTPLPFLLKAAAVALRDNPIFNASLAADGENIVYKKYIHIGVAVATPAGLMVPVVRDVNKKSIWELAAESAELAQKAKDRKLKPAEMQGGCFTISSLGGLGGTGFTPIVNTPEVAILGVSKLAVKPQWDGESFIPRKMLPLSLSYDHRAINGADAGKFFTELNALLSDIRRLLL